LQGHTAAGTIRYIEKEITSSGLDPATFQIVAFFIYYLVCEATGTAATPGLLCQPRVIMKMIMEKQIECRLAGETRGLGENLPQRHFCPSQTPT
jgi:preprotein translocase subunit Sec61beta